MVACPACGSRTDGPAFCERCGASVRMALPAAQTAPASMPAQTALPFVDDVGRGLYSEPSAQTATLTMDPPTAELPHPVEAPTRIVWPRVASLAAIFLVSAASAVVAFRGGVFRESPAPTPGNPASLRADAALRTSAAAGSGPSLGDLRSLAAYGPAESSPSPAPAARNRSRTTAPDDGFVDVGGPRPPIVDWSELRPRNCRLRICR